MNERWIVWFSGDEWTCIVGTSLVVINMVRNGVFHLH